MTTQFVKDGVRNRRVTCRICGRAVVHQPWMNKTSWALAIIRFIREHRQH